MIIKTLPSHGIDIYYDGTKLMASDTANGGYEVSRADIIAGKLVFVRHGAFQNPSFSYEVKSTDGRMSDEADYEIALATAVMTFIIQPLLIRRPLMRRLEMAIR